MAEKIVKLFFSLRGESVMRMKAADASYLKSHNKNQLIPCHWFLKEGDKQISLHVCAARLEGDFIWCFFLLLFNKSNLGWTGLEGVNNT